MTKLDKRRTIASGYLCALLTTTALVSPLLLAAPAAAVDYTGGNGAQGTTGSFPNTGCVCNDGGLAGGAGGANGFGGGSGATGATNRGYANSGLGGYGGAADGGGGGGAYYATGSGGTGGGAGGAGYLLTDGNALTSGGAIKGGYGGDGGYSTPYYFAPANYGIDGGGGGGGGGSGIIATGTATLTNTGSITGGVGGTGAFVNSYNSSYNSYAPSSYGDSGSGGAGGYGVRADSATSLALNNSGTITGGQSGDHALIGQNNAGAAGVYGQNITLTNTGGTIKGGYGATTGAGVEFTGGVNTLNLSAGSITSDYYGIGIKVDGGTNVFNISGGSVSPGTSGAYALQINGGTNTLNVTGGTLGVTYLSGGATTLQGTAYNNTMTLAHGATAAVTTAGGDVSGITSFDNHGGLSLDAGRSITLGSFTNESDGTLTLGAGAQLISSNLNLIAGSTITGAGSLSSGSAAYSLASGSISAALAGTGGLTKTGSGTLTLTGANTYTGGTIISGGTLAVAFGALGGGDVHMAEGTTIQFNGGTFITSNSFFINGDPVFNVASGTQTVSGVIADDTSATPAVPGVVEKTGAGELLLTGANTYTGGTILSAGTLTVGVGSVRDTNFALVSSAIGLGSLTLDGGTLTTDVYHTLYNDVQITSNGGTIDSGAHAFEVFGDITGNAGTLTIAGSAGGSVILGGTNTYSTATVVAVGGTLQPTSFDSLSVNSDYTVNGTLNLRQLGGGDYTIKSLSGTGSVTNTLGGNSLLTIAPAAAQTATFDGTIGDAGGGNPHVGIAISGAGMQIFTQANSYSGGTTLTAGTLEISNAGALGNGQVTFNGGTLKVDGAYGIGNAIRLNASGGTIDNGGNAIMLSGNITDGTTPGLLSLSGGGTTSLTGDNSGFSGGLSVTAGTLALSGPNSAGSGDIAAHSATVAFDAAGSYANNFKLDTAATFLVNDFTPDHVILNGVISDLSGSAGLTLTGNTPGATAELAGANTYTGGTTLDGGIVARIGVDTVGTAGHITSGALGTGTVTVTSGSFQAGGDYILANDINLSVSSAIDANGHAFSLSGLISGTGALYLTDSQGGGSIAMADASNSFLSGVIVNNVTVILTGSSGTGTGPLGTGPVTLNGGTLRADSPGHLDNLMYLDTNGGTLRATGGTYSFGPIADSGVSDALTIGASGDTGTVALADGSSYSGGTTIAGGTVFVTGTTPLGDHAASVIMHGGTTLAYDDLAVISNPLQWTGNVTLGVDTGSAEQHGNVSDDSPTAPYTVTKTGAGTLLLSGTNNSSANVTLAAGTLEIGNFNALGSGTYTFDGGTLKVDNGWAISNDLRVLSGGTLDTNGYNVELDGTLSSDSTGGALTITGAGAVQISGVNNLAGGANLGANTVLIVAGASGLSAGDVSMAAGSSIQFSAASGTFTNRFLLDGDPIFYVNSGLTTTLTGVVSDLPAGTPGVVENSGPGTLILAGANTYSGGTVLNDGILQVGIDTVGTPGSIISSAIGTGALTFNGGGTLQAGGDYTLANAIDLTSSNGSIDANGYAFALTGLVSGAHALTFTDSLGGGSVTVSAASTYSGGTTIDGTTVILGGGSSGPSTGPLGAGTITLNGGTLQAGQGGFLVNAIALDTNGGTLRAGNYSYFFGAISDGGTPGVLTIGAAGDTGTVVLASGSTYTGGTTVAGGIARVQGDDSFGDSAGFVTINDGATVQYDDTVNIANTLLLNGSAKLDVENSDTATQSGDILESAASNLEKTGTGTLVLTGGNNYSGKTVVSAGTLQVSLQPSSLPVIPYNSDVEVASGATLAFDGSLGSVDIGSLADHAGAGGTVTIGTGTELFVGGFNGSAGINTNNTTFSGAVTGGDLTYDGAGTLTLTGSTNSVEALIICGCVSTGGITLSAGHMTASYEVNVESGTLTVENGAVLDVGNGNGFRSTGGAVVVTGIGTAVTVDYDTAVTNDFKLAAALQIVSAGAHFSSTGDSYVTTDGVVGATATALVTGTGSIWTANRFFVGYNLAGGNGTLTVADGGKVVAPGGISLALGSTLNIGDGGLAGIIDAPTISGGGSNKIVANFTDTGTLSAQVTGNLSLTKQGSGTLILTGANTYSGVTTISGGTLQIGNGGKLGSGAVVDNGTLAFNTVAPMILASIVNGSGGLTQQGSGTLTLTANDGYTGETNIAANATLKLTGSGRIQSSSVVTDNGVLDISTSGGTAIKTLAGNGSVLLGSNTLQFLNGSTTFSGSITDGGAGGSVEFVSGNQILTGNNSWTGTTTLSAGATLTVASPSSLGSGSLIFNNGSTLKFTGGGIYTQAAEFAQVNAPIYDVGASTVIWSGQITGVGDLAVTGNGGTLVLTNTANSYGGGTEVYGGAALKVDADSELGATATTLQLGDATTTGTLRFGGAFTLNAARSIVLGAGGGIIDTNGNSVTIAQAITGGGLTKIGAGNLILTGASGFTGPALVNAGTLSVNGSLVSGATVNSGGTLGGTGTIGVTTVASGGTIAPGNSIGTLHVNGNLTLVSGSTIAIEISPTAADQIAVSGTATIGGTLAFNQGAGSYTTGTDLKLITASSVNGVFSGVTGLSVAGLDANVTYSATAVDLILTAPATSGGSGSGSSGGGSSSGGGTVTNSFLFGTYGKTPNQIAAGTGLAAGTNTGALYGTTGNLVAANLANVPGALGQMAGDIHASVRSAVIEDSRIIRDAVLGRLDQAGEHSAVWGSAFGGYGSIAGDGNAAALHHDSAGFIAGADMPVSDGIRLGVAAAYSTDRASTSGHLSTASGNNGHVIGYAGWTGSAIDLKLGGDYGWGTTHTARQIAALGQTLAGRQDQRMGQVFADAGYRIDSEHAMFEPYADIAHVEATSGSFAERGGNAALSGGSVTDGLTYGTLGLRAALAKFSLQDIGIAPKIDLGWRHAFDTLKPGQLVSFQDTGTSFTVLGVPLETDAAALQLGFDVTLTPDAKLSLGYDGTFGSRVQNNAIRGAFQWAF